MRGRITALFPAHYDHVDGYRGAQHVPVTREDAAYFGVPVEICASLFYCCLGNSRSHCGHHGWDRDELLWDWEQVCGSSFTFPLLIKLRDDDDNNNDDDGRDGDNDDDSNDDGL